LALLEAVGEGKVARTEITAYHARQLKTLGEPRILELLQKYWGAIRETPAEKAELIASWKERLTDDNLEEADLSNGRLVYKKTCATCHRLYGDGERIGPDLTGSNRDNLDYLLDNILDPSAVVAQDYRISNIILVDGRVISGIVGAKTDRTINVQTQERLLVIDRDDIEEMVASPLSLMADGLLQPLNEEQVRDLIAYLQGRSQVPLPEGTQDDTAEVGF
jgi:putative heme-binding domain-containing protein